MKGNITIAKNRLIVPVVKRLQKTLQPYYEPFLGAGAVLFEPKNCELMNIYQVIKNDVEELLTDLRRHQNNKECFYKLKELDRDKEEFKNSVTSEANISRKRFHA
jgi:DNA adenine methylase